MMCKGHSRQFGGHYWEIDEKGYGKCKNCPATRKFLLYLKTPPMPGRKFSYGLSAEEEAEARLTAMNLGRQRFYEKMV